MTPKLLLALALVGAVHGEPSAPTKAMTAPATPDKTYTAPASLAAPVAVDDTVLGSISDDWNSPDRVYTFSSAMKGKIVVHREPTVNKKPDGTWEITFAGKKTEPAASFFSSVAGGTPMTPEMIAASKIMPPPPLTTIWGDDVKPPNITRYHFILFTTASGKQYEAGLRSDGCVVWRERK